MSIDGKLLGKLVWSDGWAVSVYTVHPLSPCGRGGRGVRENREHIRAGSGL